MQSDDKTDYGATVQLNSPANSMFFYCLLFVVCRGSLVEIYWGSSFVTQAPPHVENHGKEPGYEAIGDHL